MKISTKGRYGLRILLDLALNADVERPRLLRDIAESQGISEKYLSRLIIELRQANLVVSVRGAKGGYRLAKEPSEITVLEVVEVMEGPIGIVECVEPRKDFSCLRGPVCAAREMWEGISAVLRDALAKVTIDRIIARQKDLGTDFQGWDYCI